MSSPLVEKYSSALVDGKTILAIEILYLELKSRIKAANMLSDRLKDTLRRIHDRDVFGSEHELKVLQYHCKQHIRTVSWAYEDPKVTEILGYESPQCGGGLGSLSTFISCAVTKGVLFRDGRLAEEVRALDPWIPENIMDINVRDLDKIEPWIPLLPVIRYFQVDNPDLMPLSQFLAYLKKRVTDMEARLASAEAYRRSLPPPPNPLDDSADE